MLKMTDRKLGRTEPEYGLAGKVLKPSERTLRLGPKGRRLQMIDQLMSIVMASDLMTTLGRFAHEPRIRVSDVAEYKERRAGTRFVQYIKQAMCRVDERRHR